MHMKRHNYSLQPIHVTKTVVHHIQPRFRSYITMRKLSHLMTKPTKWNVRPAKTPISLGIRPVWSESSLSAWRNLGSLATHWAHSEDWSDWVDAQADLSLCWALSHFVGFVMRRLSFSCTYPLISPVGPMSVQFQFQWCWDFASSFNLHQFNIHVFC